MPWSGTASAGSGTRFAVGKPSVRPRLSPWATIPRIPNGAPSSRAASATGAGRDQPADVRRGDDLAVDLDQLAPPASSNALCVAQQRRVAAARGCRSGSSRRPTPTSRRAARQLVVDELLRRLRHPLAVERDHDQLVDAERRRSGRPSARAWSAAWARTAGATTVRGCGSKVSTLSAPRDHLAVADVHAVELAHRQAARPGRRVREPGDVHQPRKPTTGLSVAPPRGSASAIRPSASRSRHDARGAAGNGRRRARPCARASPLELDHRQERRARRRAPMSRSSSASATSKSPIRVRRSSTQ